MSTIYADPSDESFSMFMEVNEEVDRSRNGSYHLNINKNYSSNTKIASRVPS